MEIKRTALFGKLDSVAYKSVESATVFCKVRGNPYVELIHWIYQIIQIGDSDVQHILKHFQIDASRLSADMTASLDRLPRGASAISDFSNHLEIAIKEGWMYSSILFNAMSIRTGHLMIGIKKSRDLANVLHGMSREFEKISADELLDDFLNIVADSPEAASAPSDSFTQTGDTLPGEASDALSPALMGKQEALKQFTVDMTERAASGEMDPIVGRDDEIRKIIDVLMRRRQNNPILTGEAGVGKTAVVEGFAQRIAAGDVPPPLRGVKLLSLDMGLLQAGASMKGEFENRLKQIIEEVQSSPDPIILFIDEAHTLIGAGGAAGQNDAANLLKPALARGTLRTVAATTWAEYKKYFEKDPALTRRFQNILVEEPGDDNAVKMMRSLASMLEKHHKVLVLDEALEAAVHLSRRYIPARQLPDKAVSVLDTACARVAISQNAEPAEVEDSRRRIDSLNIEMEIIDREVEVGIEHVEKKRKLSEALKKETKRHEALNSDWMDEKKLVDDILELREKLRSGDHLIDDVDQNEKSERPADEKNKKSSESSDDVESAAAPKKLSKKEREKALKKLCELQKKLEKKQGESPLILPNVDQQAVAVIVGEWTGIPVGRMVKNEIQSVLGLGDIMGKRVIGQSLALESISKRIQTARASLADPNKPIAVMMLAGPSGVGKTETALALAESLYGGEQNLITINMSEFQEAHTVSTLKGAPPGYVGYGEGGVLTEAVRRKPYSVVLLDEIEKAHPDVHEIFFQVFDKGRMEDGEGRLIDFRNTVILLTTNVGSDLIMNMCKDPELMPDPDGISDAMREPLLKTFPAALLGRMVVIPYYPLSTEMMGRIIDLKIDMIQSRVEEHYQAKFTYDDAVKELIIKRCDELESGARIIDSIITNTLLPRISGEFLTRTMNGKALAEVAISVADDDFKYTFTP
ncbi:MAG: type VI secretion system ATPase TssH [Kiritimatiellaeota bacterium]|nr:type VI secretion system ATPase TssH [Kiritimatiellota bacterium]